MRIGVDTGGTFTDAVVADGGRLGIGKALTTRHDLRSGILASIEAAAADLGHTLDEVLASASTLAHATTVGINALLTGTGATVALMTTAGFEATVPIARANKVLGLPEQYRTEAIHWDKPPLLVPRRRIAGLIERIDRAGAVVVPLDIEHARACIERLPADVDAVAVSLLWSVANPVHERQVADLLGELRPDVHVTLSSVLAPRIGEYERSMTTALNAYVGPLVGTYLDELRDELTERGFTGRFVVMQSSGGVSDATVLAKRPVDTLNSGPVGGVTAAASLSQRLDLPHAVATDVGGTSFDVGLVVDHRPAMSARPMIERYPLATPVVDIASIGTGGGSVAWLDPTLGSLRVGPESAGADPGPACYGRGGSRPTVTDAAVVLGYLARLGGELQLDHDAARRSIADELATPLDRSVEQVADDILRVANAQMADLVRRSTVRRGHDPSHFTLVAYGGAAPQYVGRYAADLGVAGVVVPALASVFSAYGAAFTDRWGHAALEGAPRPLAAVVAELDELMGDLEVRARDDLGEGGTGRNVVVERSIGLRFAGQVHELTVGFPEADDRLEAIEASFRARYEQLVGSGTAHSRAAIEVLRLSVTARIPISDDTARAGAEPVERDEDTRDGWFDGERRPCPVVAGDTMTIGETIDGPAFIELPTTTLVVYPGQAARIDDDRNLHLLLESS